MTILNWVALGLVLVASAGILLVRDWRWMIGLLAVQYLGVFWLVQASWNISLASGKLVTGWMICAVLGIAHANKEEEQVSGLSWPQGQFFRLAVIALVFIVTYTAGIGLMNWLGMALPSAWGGLLLIGMGLLHTGITNQPFRVIVGLLTALSGFEIIYAAVESSILVTGLLSLVNLGLSLAGAYFLSHQVEKGEQ